MTTEILLDGVLVVLLVATILYAAILNRHLKTLRQGKDELRALIEEFNGATDRARGGMESLRLASEISGAELKEYVDRAQALRDDLGFLLERGTMIADRLEGSISAARRPPRGRPRDVNEVRDAGITEHTPPMETGDETADIPADVKENLRKILEATR